MGGIRWFIHTLTFSNLTLEVSNREGEQTQSNNALWFLLNRPFNSLIDSCFVLHHVCADGQS